MATVHVTLSASDDRLDSGLGAPVLTSVPILAQTITSSASNQVSTIASTRANNQFWSVTATGGNVWVSFGAAPVAAAGSGHLVLAGQTRDWSVTTVGEKIAIKD